MKAVVDAYDGTVDLYVVDDVDPIIKAYEKAFPDLFQPVSAAPEGLQEHFRYPEDLFRVQTQMWSRYHVTDPDTFYNGNDAWTVPQEPGVSGLTGASATAATGADRPAAHPRGPLRAPVPADAPARRRGGVVRHHAPVRGGRRR